MNSSGRFILKGKWPAIQHKLHMIIRAEELKKRLGFTHFDTAAFLNVGAKYPDYPFASYLTEMIDEQLYDFIRENYRAE